MKDLVTEGKEIQKKFTESLRELGSIGSPTGPIVNVSEEYLDELRNALLADLKKNPTWYNIGKFKAYVDDTGGAGATGGAIWSNKESSRSSYTIYATPFWDGTHGIPIDVYDDESGEDIQNYDAKITSVIINNLSTDLRKDLNLVRNFWKQTVSKVINGIQNKKK